MDPTSEFKPSSWISQETKYGYCLVLTRDRDIRDKKLRALWLFHGNKEGLAGIDQEITMEEALPDILNRIEVIDNWKEAQEFYKRTYLKVKETYDRLFPEG